MSLRESTKGQLVTGGGMNILVYESPLTLASFIRSVLRAKGYRVAVSSEPEEAILKMDTGLFDALVFGPSGAPEDLADYVQTEFSQLPIVLAGVPADAPAQGQVVAVLPAPLSAHRLLAAFRKIAHRRQRKLSELSVELGAEGVCLSCRLAELTPESMVIAGESDEFARYFGSRPRRVTARIGDTCLEGEIAGTDTALPRRVNRVNVRLDGAGAREVLLKLIK